MSATSQQTPSTPLRVLELYCGIGGCAAALTPALRDGAAEVIAALDVNHLALAVYRHNFPHPALARNLESIPLATWQSWAADLWWLSPPCQPFTRRGLGRDDEDPRTASLLHLLALIPELRPRYLALENVPGFVGSRTHGRLRGTLAAAGYQVSEQILCPSELGVPNRRRRVYLLAARGDLAPQPAAPPRCQPLRECLDPGLDEAPPAHLAVDPELLGRYTGALHLLDPGDPKAVASCFTAAYGRSPVRSGSYLVTATGVRRFDPGEVLRLLGFPASYRLPPGLPPANAWRLAGNSLSIPAVTAVLARIPELAPTLAPAAGHA